MYAITEAEIDQVLNLAHEQEDSGGTAYSGMSFEQGIAQGIEWACGIGDDTPPLPLASELAREIVAGSPPHPQPAVSTTGLRARDSEVSA